MLDKKTLHDTIIRLCFALYWNISDEKQNNNFYVANMLTIFFSILSSALYAMLMQVSIVIIWDE